MVTKMFFRLAWLVLLKCPVQSHELHPMFRRNILPPPEYQNCKKTESFPRGNVFKLPMVRITFCKTRRHTVYFPSIYNFEQH